MTWAALTRDTLRELVKVDLVGASGGMKPVELTPDLIAAMDEVRESMARAQENRILGLFFDPPGPAFTLWPAPTIEEVKPAFPTSDLRLLVGWRGLVMEPKYSLLLLTDTVGCGPPELRCGPYTTPSGKQWAVVRDRDTGRRRVVDWPLP